MQWLVGYLVRNRALQVNKLNNTNKRYLNVGCGPNLNEEFINLDYAWRPGLDLCWDITNGFPLRNNSLDGIYTEHCLEHITFEQAQAVLFEFYRMLKPGGNVRIIVPDAELYIELYTKFMMGEQVYFPYVTDAVIEGGFSPIMSVNRVFRGHGHLFAYDYDCLSLMLTKSGFKDIEKSSFMKGRNEVLLIDSEIRKIESVYVEATKPG